jgi:hypothetical protein
MLNAWMPRWIGCAFLMACGGSPATPSIPPAAPAAPAVVQQPARKVLVNVDDQGVALHGYDPISYRTLNAPVAGSPGLTSVYDATYLFTTADHKAAFDREPASAAPRFGGYCAYAASQGRLSPVQPEVFEVVDGALLLFTNQEFRRLFAQDPLGLLAKAEANWPGLIATYGKPASQR